MNERKLLFKNPATLLFLGAVPALGASADLRAALGMSAAVLGVLLLSALILGLLRNLIPSGARLPRSTAMLPSVPIARSQGRMMSSRVRLSPRRALASSSQARQRS